MYILTAQADFDSAHFLHGYEGKCSNLHGHRWHIEAKVKGELIAEGQQRGMVVDFGDLKHDLRAIADSLDHILIYEEGSLMSKTVDALCEEGFRLFAVPFRPTAENLARYIYDKMKSKGYDMVSLTVYETPDNCAEYSDGI
ncbi:MAG: 6-carboxytetrahydropterin synthase QueD [Oscillospiraceae bacterium]|nr:6-carboxytetrahydropterin synthase QueD [Oscillospiraceae bacterium]